jgi:hypothetical protein
VSFLLIQRQVGHGIFLKKFYKIIVDKKKRLSNGEASLLNLFINEPELFHIYLHRDELLCALIPLTQTPPLDQLFHQTTSF